MSQTTGQGEITIIGDGATDLFLEEIPHHHQTSASRNWERCPGHQIHRLDGGALLVGAMIARAVGAPEQRETSDATPTFIQSLATIERAAQGASWRVARFLGFQRPAGELTSAAPTRIDRPNGSGSILVVDNAGNGFRDQQAAWSPYLSSKARNDLVVLKMSAPLPLESKKGTLWQAFVDTNCPQKIIIVNARDLRNAGVDLSSRLSWDRSVEDLRRQRETGALQTLGRAGKLVIRFGLEGAAILEEGRPVSIICESGACENDTEFAAKHHVPGLTSAFTAALVASLSENGASLGDAVSGALVVARRFFTLGFIMERPTEPERTLTIPIDKLFERADSAGRSLFSDGLARHTFVQIIDAPREPKSADHVPSLRPNGWVIAEADNQLAQDILRKGAKRNIDKIPHAAIGRLLIADRVEIENYRSIANLMSMYASDLKQRRPLSIAVFGSPGSGKSYGINAIAAALNDTGRAVEKIKANEFNVAQWKEPRDLVEALHVARDRRIAGELPLVFFDEFDSDNRKWLKSFLLPMQDGAFKDGSRNHTVDRAIFIFAGGTAKRMEEFKTPDPKDSDAFKNEKRPDFISRLSGYVDVSSINAPGAAPTAPGAASAGLGADTAPGEPSDLGYRLRRAIVLRGLFEGKYPHLFDRHGELQIDDDVLGALLTVPAFHHEVRSVEAILRMSDLGISATRFARSALPSDAQIELHTRAKSFEEKLG